MRLLSKLQVLTDDDMEKVHESTLKLLWEKGVSFQSKEAISLLKHHGATVNGNNVRFPNDMVMQALSQCPQTFHLEALNPQRSVTVGDGLLIHPAGGEVFIQDFEDGRRSPTLGDFADLQKIYQACSELDIAGYQPLSPIDVPDRTKGLHCVLESMKHSDKPILSPMELDTVVQKEECLKLFEIAYGKDGYLDNHYVTWHAVCPNSPLFYSDFACEGIKVYAERNQPVLVVSAPMTGITSPIYLYSTVVLQIAEILAGLVLAQLYRPGVPVIPSASLTYGNMRYASWECACPDTALMLVASVQMFKDFYHLPSRAQTGVTSSKIIDYQAGMESIQSFMLTALAGVSLCSQSLGTLENLMTTSLEKTIIDNEMISRVRHILDGMNTSEEALGMDILMEARPCQDFMTHPSTLDHLKDGWQPQVSDWRSYDAWQAQGAPEILDAAHTEVEKILSSAPESFLPPEMEEALSEYIRHVEEKASVISAHNK